MAPQQANIEYFFRLLYEWIYGTHGANYEELRVLASHIWLWIIAVGYLLSVIALVFIVYTTVRLFELRKREDAYYGTLVSPPESGGENPRWKHIESLANSQSASEWREAIIEADIMLDDILARQGYVGAGVGEKLKAVEPSDMGTLQDAWEAHKVRNQIAHEGSAFKLSDSLTHRTIARYAAVFRELKAI
ncbi:TPA: hypothetical protein DIV48_03245 [Candidatus Kaiserbacteria bacterium]|nr:MAG: hypothetical protein UY93_C0003G0085 [Parcubacteria group bacterium GW2011_GWA1_56_13]KKW46902.1 MAG: hypothetical protein UY97_C0002G0013 [Parcubacteria group bacterium GW2011_GWB1_57_6]HCR52628.1 hypothetical protein [Candidatus Kaiserbacteria bacterium]